MSAREMGVCSNSTLQRPKSASSVSLLYLDRDTRDFSRSGKSETLSISALRKRHTLRGSIEHIRFGLTWTRSECNTHIFPENKGLNKVGLSGLEYLCPRALLGFVRYGFMCGFILSVQAGALVSDCRCDLPLRGY